MTALRLIAGLGNPGGEYAKTRHNAGFWFVDELVRAHGGRFGSDAKLHGETCKLDIGGQQVCVLKPSTFMNRSGQSVGAALRYFKLAPEDMLVVHDELDLPPGTARLKFDGGHGGQNGLRDIAAHLGHGKFHRLRIGIGRPLPGWTVVKHVLAPFSEEDAPKIREAIDYLLPALECVVTDSVDLAMNRYNPKKQKAKKKQQAAVQEAPEIMEAAAAQEEK